MSKKDKKIHAKLIANPGAGKPQESAKQLETATRCLRQLGIEVDVALAKPKEEATPLAKQAVKDGYKLVIAMGGDGTLEAILRGMVGSKTRLGIIPIGTKNNMAKSLGIPANIEEACALIASKNTRKLDVGQVRVKNGKKLYFFELTAVGLVAALYPNAKKLSDGKLSNLKDAALTLIHHESEPKVYLTLDDESKIEIKTMLVVVSNAPMFGDNFLVAPDASLRDGLLDISVYPNFSKAELIAYYTRIRDEGYSANEKVQRYRARKLEIKASPKMEVMADGVMLGKGKVEIKSRAGALWVITPPEEAAPATLNKEAAEELPAPVAPVPEKNQAETALQKNGQ
ncbi:MAG TPA: diacylglycerol kinase family protein [Anaerolineales bacterium]|nr:diacylglycerol kinase family protein [Anaerolineales bacterium]